MRQLTASLLADLAVEEARKAELERERARQFEEINDLTRSGRVDVEAASQRRFHGGVLLGEIEAVDRRRNVVEQQLSVCRRALVEADREVRVLERLREKRRVEHAYESGRREQLALEDAWVSGRSREAMA